MKRILMISFLIVGLSAVYLNLSAVAAQSYTIKEMTPDVEQALDGRRNRYDQLRALKDERRVGEDNKGYVQVLVPDNEAQAVVNGENKDRKVIYETIAQQNNLSDSLKTIEQVFAQVKRDKAEPGDMIQNEKGEWVEK